MICLAGLFNFLQAPLDAATHQQFGDDPVPVNVMLLVTAVVAGTAVIGYVGWRSRTMARDKLESEAEGASESLMPGAESRSYGT